MNGSKTVRDVIHMWLWWSTFVVANASGSNATAAYKRAQKATARLYA